MLEFFSLLWAIIVAIMMFLIAIAKVIVITIGGVFLIAVITMPLYIGAFCIVVVFSDEPWKQKVKTAGVGIVLIGIFVAEYVFLLPMIPTTTLEAGVALFLTACVNVLITAAIMILSSTTPLVRRRIGR